MTPDIERVARAICTACELDGSDEDWKFWQTAAIAAIKAMENPSSESIYAVPSAYGNPALYSDVEAGAMAWNWLQGHRAMIRAALGEE